MGHGGVTGLGDTERMRGVGLGTGLGSHRERGRGYVQVWGIE